MLLALRTRTPPCARWCPRSHIPTTRTPCYTAARYEAGALAAVERHADAIDPSRAASIRKSFGALRDFCSKQEPEWRAMPLSNNLILLFACVLRSGGCTDPGSS